MRLTALGDVYPGEPKIITSFGALGNDHQEHDCPPKGEKEVLITSVLDPKTIVSKNSIAKSGVKEAYKRLKSRLEVENSSGKSVHAVKQNFYAKMITYNLAALLAKAAEPKVKKETAHCQYVMRSIMLRLYHD